MKRLCLLLFLISLASVTLAQEVVLFRNGDVNGDGYTWKDGLWTWYDTTGVLHYYKRTQQSYQEPYSYCRGYGCPTITAYRTAYRYNYYEIPAPVPIVAAAPALRLPLPSDTQWRSKLLDIKRTMTEIDGSMRFEALNNQLYLDAVQQLGLGGELAMQNYGRTMQYPFTAMTATNYQIGSFGVNGQTIYGHRRSTMSELYGAVDPSLLYQQSSMLTKNAQDWGGKAHDNFTGLVAQDAEGRAYVAATYAKAKAAGEALSAAGSAAAQALQAAEGTSQKVRTTETTTIVSPQVQGSVNIPIPQPAPQNGNGGVDTRKQLEVVIANRCFGCHGPDKQEAHLDMRQYFTFDDNKKDVIWQRMTSNDPAQSMPRNPDTGLGVRLSNEELKLFLVH